MPDMPMVKKRGKREEWNGNINGEEKKKGKTGPPCPPGKNQA